ncbi:MAG: hypothetical protein CR988_01935 [Treponema sp.]|nr:MAG: hypothetical protein CR988_01935 [Treponema sp.]
MNKKKFVFVLFLISIFCTAIFAEVKKSELYYVNVKILRIFTHSKGYYVIYRRAGLKTGEAFIPYEWFSIRDGRAKLEKASGRIDPYMSLFSKNGEFDHVKLYVPSSPKSPEWGNLRNQSEYDDKFNIEALELKY